MLNTLIVYKMGLLNENQISHMNLLTPAVFHLLLTAMLRTRFFEECMGFLLSLRVFFRLFLSELSFLYSGKRVILITRRARNLHKEKELKFCAENTCCVPIYTFSCKQL